MFDIDVCGICRETLSEGEVKVLPCNHPFHNECVEGWLSRVPSCPFCRVYCGKQKCKFDSDYYDIVMDYIGDHGASITPDNVFDTLAVRYVITAIETMDYTDRTWLNISANNPIHDEAIQDALSIYRRYAPVVNPIVVYNITTRREFLEAFEDVDLNIDNDEGEQVVSALVERDFTEDTWLQFSSARLPTSVMDMYLRFSYTPSQAVVNMFITNQVLDDEFVLEYMDNRLFDPRLIADHQYNNISESLLCDLLSGL